MEYLPLPWLSARLGRPVLAAAEAFCGSAAASSSPLALPPEVYLLSICWPAARFMTRLPAELPGEECYDRLDVDQRVQNRLAWEEWVDLFLCEVVERPRLTLDEIRSLGPDRDVLALGLLRLWGWLSETEWTQFLLANGLELAIRFPTLPSAAFQAALHFMAKTYKRLPSEFLDLSFPAFVFNYQVTMTASRQRAHTASQEEEMLDAIGVET